MSSVGSLPPVQGISDAAVREFCEAVSNIIDARSGNIETARNDRFITYSEISTVVGDQLLGFFRGGDAGNRPGNPGGTGSVLTGIRDIQRDIMNSELWRVLGEEFRLLVVPDVRRMVGPLSDGITAINNVTATSESASARTLFAAQVSVGSALAQIVQINEVSATSGSANARFLFALNVSVSALGGTVGAITAGLTNEINARVTTSAAIATAVNTIWAAFGSAAQAIIGSGDNLQANATTAQATRWTQVQSAVRDPNTNEIASASILQEYRTYANAADGRFSAMYTLRVEVQPGTAGVPYVGGFGIVGGVSDVTLYPTIDFGVRADRFWVGSPSGAADHKVPFIVITTPGQVVAGKTYPAVGVWMDSAMIANATIDFAQITDTIRSDIFVPGVSGWRILKDGTAEFNNVTIRGTVYASSGQIGRLVVTGAVEGTILVPNNTASLVTHGEGRKVMVTLWIEGAGPTSAGGQLPYISAMTDNSFSVRAAFSGDVIVGYRYW